MKAYIHSSSSVQLAFQIFVFTRKCDTRPGKVNQKLQKAFSQFKCSGQRKRLL